MDADEEWEEIWVYEWHELIGLWLLAYIRTIVIIWFFMGA